MVLATALALALVAGESRGQAPTYDLVIANGRAIDPETGLDAVRWIGVRNGSIAAISPTALRGKETLDAQIGRAHV